MIIFAKKLGLMSYETLCALDRQISYLFKVKINIVQKISLSIFGPSLHILIYRIFGILFVPSTLFVIYQIVSSMQ